MHGNLPAQFINRILQREACDLYGLHTARVNSSSIEKVELRSVNSRRNGEPFVAFQLKGFTAIIEVGEIVGGRRGSGRGGEGGDKRG